MKYPEAHEVKGTLGLALDDVFCALEMFEDENSKVFEDAEVDGPGICDEAVEEVEE